MPTQEQAFSGHFDEGATDSGKVERLQPGHLYIGDARELLRRVEPESVALSVWSPPYFVGKSYEQHMTYDEWRALLAEVIQLHYPIVRPGGFVAINIADILCFRDATMPRVQADSVDRKPSPVTREAVLEAMARYPHLNRYQLAQLLGCSAQTIDRRLRVYWQRYNRNRCADGAATVYRHRACARIRATRPLQEVPVAASEFDWEQ